jgi:fermentation-respiration switch protein FrsA (DUF1100 family)
LRLLSIVIAFLLMVLGAGLAAFLLQRAVLFPRSLAVAWASNDSAERIALSAGGALFLPATSGVNPRPLILFAHGNAETAGDWIDEFSELRRDGWSVLLLEYPGYAGVGGSPSQASIEAAALTAYDWAVTDPRVDRTQIVVYGRSLGGGAVTPIAVKRPVAGLILESAFTSVRPLAARFLVPGFLVRDPFDNLAALRSYRGPLLVLHGRRDEVIPFDHGEALSAAVPGSTFVPVDCGHNDCPRPWAAFRSWTRAHSLGQPRLSPPGSPNR